MVSGFWHGSSWNFIAWGFIHACGFLPLLLLNRNRKHVTDVVAQDQAVGYFKHIGLSIIEYPSQFIHPYFYQKYFFSVLIYIVPFLVIDWFMRANERNLKTTNNKIIKNSLYIIILTIIAIYIDTVKSNFIYFQF